MSQPKDSPLRNPLGRARGLGSAKEGFHHWWMQRLSGAALVPLCIFLAFYAPDIASADHAAFTAWITGPCAAIAIILFIFSAFYHAMLGIQVIVEDYVHGEGMKVFLLTLNRFFFFLLGIAAVWAVLHLNFGSHT